MIKNSSFPEISGASIKPNALLDQGVSSEFDGVMAGFQAGRPAFNESEGAGALKELGESIRDATEGLPTDFPKNASISEKIDMVAQANSKIKAAQNSMAVLSNMKNSIIGAIDKLSNPK